ncbi:MAG TPA: hypothetical protein VGM23_14625 [Armatimonadota bacterium]|jgi:hydrogenase-4 component E
MHFSSIDLLAAGAALLAVWMCGLTRLETQLWGLALQTTFLGLICWLLGQGTHGLHFLLLAGVILLVKALGIPFFLSWASQRLTVSHDIGTTSPPLSLLAGCSILIVSYFLAPQIAVTTMGNAGAAGMALSLLLTGMLVMITRRLAISQIIGFLMLENGIFLYGLTQTHGMPLLLEMGIVFEVLVGVMIAGLVIFRLNRSFEHIDVTQLRGLRH